MFLGLIFKKKNEVVYFLIHFHVYINANIYISHLKHRSHLYKTCDI